MAKKKAVPAKKAVKNIAPAVDPVELEMKQLQLEDLRDTVEKKKAFRELRQMQLRSQELTLAAGRKDQARIQAGCRHRKGGRDKQGVVNLQHGTDDNFSIIVHTYPNMMTVVMCQRCQFEWRPGDTKDKLIPRFAGDTGQKNPTRTSYEDALAWPTDNEPSGASLFLVPLADSALQQQIVALQRQLAALQNQGSAA